MKFSIAPAFANFEHSIRMDLNRRPVFISGDFKSTPQAPEDDVQNCTIQVELTEAQASKPECPSNAVSAFFY